MFREECRGATLFWRFLEDTLQKVAKKFVFLANFSYICIVIRKNNMKILHTSDLHIGKRVSGYSMLDDQRYILNQIVHIAASEKPDAMILAGDIYDKAIPSGEAVALFDEFLVNLSRLRVPLFIISGNHDSQERLAFASRIMKESGVYVSPVYDGKITPVILRDEWGEVAFYLLPFVKPSMVQHYAETDKDLTSYDAAMRYVVEQMELNKECRNVLVAHQLVTGAERSDSEDLVIGGLDNVDGSVFDSFDYVALGHLHRPQYCGRKTLRYSGSPLKYSFSEVDDKKSLTVVEMKEKGCIEVKAIPLMPQYDWHDLRGSYDELTLRSYYEQTSLQEDYVRITLTDEDDIPDGMRKLQAIYHRLMELRYDNQRTRAGLATVGGAIEAERKSPIELFGELFEKQNEKAMDNVQKQYVEAMIKDVWNQNA